MATWPTFAAWFGGFVHLFAIWVVLHTLDSAAAFYCTCWVFLSYALGTQGTFSRRAAPHKLIYVNLCWYDIHLWHPLTFNFSR
jgi:hypothetical protein